jgi:hypothetical protein
MASPPPTPFLSAISVTPNDETTMNSVIGLTIFLIVVGTVSIYLRGRLVPLTIDKTQINRLNPSLVIAAFSMIALALVPFFLFTKANDWTNMHSYVYCYQIARLNYCQYIGLISLFIFSLLLVANQLFFFNWQMVFIIVVMATSLLALKPTFHNCAAAHNIVIALGVFTLFLFMIFTGRAPWWIFLLLIVPGFIVFVWYAILGNEPPEEGGDLQLGVTAQSWYLAGSLAPIVVFAGWLVALPWIPRQRYADAFIKN